MPCCKKKLLCNVDLLTPTCMQLLGVFTEKKTRAGKLCPWPCGVWVPQQQSIGQQIPNFTCMGHAGEQGCVLGAAQEAASKAMGMSVPHRSVLCMLPSQSSLSRCSVVFCRSAPNKLGLFFPVSVMWMSRDFLQM